LESFFETLLKKRDFDNFPKVQTESFFETLLKKRGFGNFSKAQIRNKCLFTVRLQAEKNVE